MKKKKESGVLRTTEIAAQKGVGTRAVQKWIHTGLCGVRLKAERFGRSWVVSVDDWNEFKSRVTKSA